MNVYSRIYDSAKKHGMSIKELARKAHIGENSIYRWKTIKPSIQSLTKVAQQLHVSTDYLLGQEKDNSKSYPVDIADKNIQLLYQGHEVPEKYIKMLRFIMEEDKEEKREN
ncbi:helix-turn-helix transcriptional regulator [Lactobacillus kullabergensis]|uniref:helix-turn-helix domain-containing protein n=1 Tax=Lactobacillus TaxID=1578 RepID=UPI0018DDA1C7|nr:MULTISPECIES: helix-turn-helix transcriptional regulator [Lactobacillus]MBI0120512.1 helix-turn-helix transcriptional regulator [Lactobacillus sp. M0398]MBI0122660.1 helix-turn-helix transcriptional regulator [Lactobacillus sp. W8174]MBI0134276.1 helix-turn-helix transcriptional regulator [Lactobacillus sp. W8173]MCX0290734.1 helix-turn-helix transcriptional regulator [Lactobacillus kullabergensis]